MCYITHMCLIIQGVFPRIILFSVYLVTQSSEFPASRKTLSIHDTRYARVAKSEAEKRRWKVISLFVDDRILGKPFPIHTWYHNNKKESKRRCKSGLPLTQQSRGRYKLPCMIFCEQNIDHLPKMYQIIWVKPCFIHINCIS